MLLFVIQYARIFFTMPLVLAALGGCGCSTQNDKNESQHKSAINHAPSKTYWGQNPTMILRALNMPHHQMGKALGSHLITCKATLATQVPGYPPKTINQEMTLHLDEKGQFAAVKNTHKQYGQEVIWTGGWLYPRLRYHRFLKRRPHNAKEVIAIQDRMVGYLPAYLDLLGRFISMTQLGLETYQGRKVVQFQFQKDSETKPIENDLPLAKRWRRFIKIKNVSGLVLVDEKTRVPLKTHLEARWTFHPPAEGSIPPSGIPTIIDKQKIGTMSLNFSHDITQIGQVKLIKPPRDIYIIKNIQRRRLEWERQLILGERPIPKWLDKL
ncbi:MAG: hypothetical protein JXA79_12480 [Deltaproteobacteria bacterium]|nr:hypothetical protein [Deltaproteobacteria bacterium]